MYLTLTFIRLRKPRRHDERSQRPRICRIKLLRSRLFSSAAPNRGVAARESYAFEKGAVDNLKIAIDTRSQLSLIMGPKVRATILEI